MKNGLIIFNGIQFHYYHINYAMDWAVKNKTGLHALFIHSDKEPPEGYIFPSDIDPAEHLYGKKDAKKENISVIHSQVKLLSDIAKEKNVPLTTGELTDPSMAEIVRMTKEAEILFLDSEYDKSFILANTHFQMKDLVKKSHCPVETVYDKQGES